MSRETARIVILRELATEESYLCAKSVQKDSSLKLFNDRGERLMNDIEVRWLITQICIFQEKYAFFVDNGTLI